MPANESDAHNPFSGWCDHRDFTRPRMTLDDYLAGHQTACGGKWREEYVNGRFVGTGHYRYTCEQCGECYGTDSSG